MESERHDRPGGGARRRGDGRRPPRRLCRAGRHVGRRRRSSWPARITRRRHAVTSRYLRRLPAPASRRRELCRLHRRPYRRWRSRGRGWRRRSAPASVAAAAPAAAPASMPMPRRRRGCASASASRRATTSSTCSNAGCWRRRCSRWSRRCASLLRQLGLKRRAELQLTITDQGVDLLIAGLSPTGLAAAEAITAFCERHALARLSFDDGLGPETRWEPQPVSVTLGGVPVPFPPGGFLQATLDGEAALVAAVREAVGRPATTADLFAGLGTFALALPGKVYAAEAVRATRCSRLKAAAAQAGAAGVHRASRPLPPAADRRRARPVRGGGARSAAGRRARPGRGAGRRPAAGDRLCLVQSQQLRCRCEDAVRGRLAARLGAAGGPVPLVDACRAGRALHAS